MSEELNLVRDLAVILISAGVFTIISKALKQPLVLGYILAGFLIGPNIGFFPGISSQEVVKQWSEIGIIFLMFGLGLEFSFKKLLQAGSTALVTAGTKFVGVFVLGFLVGQALSWTLMESVFLGGLLSMSSTMVVIKSYDDMGLKRAPYAPMVFGTLVVEDLIAILLMVLLSTMAVSNRFAGSELVLGIVKLVFFLILWFLVGIYAIPTILKKARRFLSDEILLLVGIGLCFGMVALASAVGFSSALGAFVMGSILAETVESERILHLVEPIKNLFGAIFFVSVGMMVAPAVIAQHWAVILLITLVVAVTHIVFVTLGGVLSGAGLRNSIYAGFSLAQLGEFGFIIAGVGVSLGVMRDFIYPVIIAVSVITTFTTPYMIRLAAPAHVWLEQRLPAAWLERLAPVRGGRASAAEQSEWRKLLKAYFLRILLYGVVILAIGIGGRVFLEPFLHRVFPSWSPRLHDIVTVSVILAAMTPFLYGMGVNSGSINQSAPRLIREKRSNVWPIYGLVLLRTFLVIGVILFVLAGHFHLAGWTVVLVIAGVAAFIVFARRSLHRYTFLEQRFLENYNEKEAEERRRAPVTTSLRKVMAGYDVHIERIVLSPDSEYVGKPMRELPIRHESGANIIKIRRGQSSLIIPPGDTVLYPHDELFAVGTTEQLARIQTMFDASVRPAPSEKPDESFRVEHRTLADDDPLVGRTLRSTDMRRLHCMVLSVLRGDNFNTNPGPDFRFEAGDTVWVAGELDLLQNNTQ